ncbi:hypothetical protein SODALDRAFT_220085 [Sodiomyces alkalinus F11]|uniref:Transmembrane protein n=1 Tax=Sodiomyces alkalinus (strain CBS 110278 / VKM F-3762 / F11) TaxID=1314773 RepID=A0A3N2PPM8_SODAK|nr:hypothetical protein SODALDRAFT_220085 [Sodiomyces alkalinus F11]ROT36458.1 hypothetical protein SODALDRAFT_220085 [Sodiomyces alkalinus F11]
MKDRCLVLVFEARNEQRHLPFHPVTQGTFFASWNTRPPCDQCSALALLSPNREGHQSMMDHRGERKRSKASAVPGNRPTRRHAMLVRSKHQRASPPNRSTRSCTMLPQGVSQMLPQICSASARTWLGPSQPCHASRSCTIFRLTSLIPALVLCLPFLLFFLFPFLFLFFFCFFLFPRFLFFLSSRPLRSRQGVHEYLYRTDLRRRVALVAT